MARARKQRDTSTSSTRTEKRRKVNEDTMNEPLEVAQNLQSKRTNDNTKLNYISKIKSSLSGWSKAIQKA
jgi:hypothetical protein